MIRFISIPSHDALYRLLREECLTAERFVAYCEQRKLKKPEIRKLGYVSHIDLLTLLGGKSANGVRVNNDLYRAYEALIAADVFIKVSLGANQLFDIQINFSAVLLYVHLDCLENIIKGPVFTVMKYTNSTVAIIVEKQGGEFAGTGSILTNGRETFVLTNRHVVDPQEGCQIKGILLGGDPNAKLSVSSNPRLCDTDDLATLAISPPDLPSNVSPFRLSTRASILQDVMALAYPSIPRTTKLYLTAHKGEINAEVETLDTQELYLVSSYASPGSSGGPLLDSRGLILGVITRRLEANYEDGIFYHTAAVPHKRVIEFLGGHL